MLESFQWNSYILIIEDSINWYTSYTKKKNGTMSGYENVYTLWPSKSHCEFIQKNKKPKGEKDLYT